MASMARAETRSTALLAGATALVIGCGGGADLAPPPRAPSPAASENTDLSGLEKAKFSAVRSDRLGVTFLLPMREQWSVQDAADANAGWLVATLASARMTVRLKRIEASMLVGRRECIEEAERAKELPTELARAGFETLADAPLAHPKGWDGWRWVALQTRASGDTSGHAFLITARGRSCLVMHVEALAGADPASQTALADRLEIMDARVLSTVQPDRAEMPAGMVPLPVEK
jgi:hypothetical protein